MTQVAKSCLKSANFHREFLALSYIKYKSDRDGVNIFINDLTIYKQHDTYSKFIGSVGRSKFY